MMDFNIKLEGFDQLERRLMGLDLDKQRKAVLAAGRFAMRPVLEQVQQRLPKRSGLLASSMRTATRVNRATSEFPIEIGITSKARVQYEDLDDALATIKKFRAPNVRGRYLTSQKELKRSKGKKFRVTMDPSWRVHFIETGAPGRGIAAQPTIRPAFDENKQLVLARFRDRLNKLIDAAAKK